jgi:hypothetical protein
VMNVLSIRTRLAWDLGRVPIAPATRARRTQARPMSAPASALPASKGRPLSTVMNVLSIRTRLAWELGRVPCAPTTRAQREQARPQKPTASALPASQGTPLSSAKHVLSIRTRLAWDLGRVPCAPQTRARTVRRARPMPAPACAILASRARSVGRSMSAAYALRILTKQAAGLGRATRALYIP